MKKENQKPKAKILLAFFISAIFSNNVFSQEKSTVTSAIVTATDSLKTDTNYIKSYDDKLIIGLWQSESSFDLTLGEKMSKSANSTINYIANSNHVSGISLDYDVIGLSFGYKSIPAGNKRTGNTDYFDAGFNINTSGFRFENSLKNYTGFYDKNTPNYTHPFNDSTPYVQNPSMSIRQIKSKLIYSISHQRFSLGGAYSNAKRQLKSAGSVLLVYNFYGLSMSSDSSIIPVALRNFYGPVWDGFNKMNMYAFSAGAGYTRTFVIWKKIYFNFLFAVGYERQYRHYYIYPENVQMSYWKTWFAGDWRTSVGYNGKRFFMRASSVYDLNNYESTDLRFELKYFVGEFAFGWRFNLKPPKPYRKFQQTKFYKIIS